MDDGSFGEAGREQAVKIIGGGLGDSNYPVGYCYGPAKSESEEPMEFPNTPSRIQTYELEEWKPRTAPPTAKMSFPTQTIKEKNSDIFVKIDKFHSARRSLADIEDKLEEISGLLSKIREMKMREEQELSSWEKDLVALKTKMEEVNSSIFEKVD